MQRQQVPELSETLYQLSLKREITRAIGDAILIHVLQPLVVANITTNNIPSNGKVVT